MIGIVTPNAIFVDAGREVSELGPSVAAAAVAEEDALELVLESELEVMFPLLELGVCDGDEVVRVRLEVDELDGSGTILKPDVSRIVGGMELIGLGRGRSDTIGPVATGCPVTTPNELV